VANSRLIWGQVSVIPIEELRDETLVEAAIVAGVVVVDIVVTACAGVLLNPVAKSNVAIVLTIILRSLKARITILKTSRR
jgi:hypothetical protein